MSSSCGQVILSGGNFQILQNYKPVPGSTDDSQMSISETTVDTEEMETTTKKCVEAHFHCLHNYECCSGWCVRKEYDTFCL